MKLHLSKRIIIAISMLVALLVSWPAFTAESIKASEVAEMIKAGKATLILDVRTADEYASGHVPGAVNISHTELADRMSEITVAKDDEIIVYCRSGHRAGIAEKMLSEAGFTNIRDMEGHMLGWEKSGYPIESAD